MLNHGTTKGGGGIFGFLGGSSKFNVCAEMKTIPNT
eukprot:UN04935